MILLATIILGTYIFLSALFSDGIDDDDDMDGGMMAPVSTPT